jgi:hypothetical protein
MQVLTRLARTWREREWFAEVQPVTLQECALAPFRVLLLRSTIFHSS